jgi:hypothetical protein
MDLDELSNEQLGATFTLVTGKQLCWDTVGPIIEKCVTSLAFVPPNRKGDEKTVKEILCGGIDVGFWSADFEDDGIEVQEFADSPLLAVAKALLRHRVETESQHPVSDV